MHKLLMILLLVLLLPSCNLREREDRLKKREEAVNQREQELLLRETAVALREAALEEREKQDSLRAADNVVNDTIRGVWTARMTCIEATCPGSAVGDRRQERWEMQYQSAHIVATAYSGDRVVRIYTGTYNTGVLELREVQAAGAEPSNEMLVRLRINSANEMEGRREIFRESCKVVYDLKLNKEQ